MDAITRKLRELKDKDPKKFAEVVMQLPAEEAENLLFDGRIWLRDNQIFDEHEESIIFFMAGRGTGKTFAGSHFVKMMVEDYGTRRVSLIGPTAADVRDVMVLGPSGLMSVFPRGKEPLYEPSKRLVTFWNGAEALLFSAQDGDKVRGQNTGVLWCDEICSWQDEDIFNQALLTLRVEPSKCLVTSTPKPSKLIVDLYKRAGKDVKVIHGATYENLHNLSRVFREQIVGMYEGTRLGAQELEGKLLLDVPGALWTSETLSRCTVDMSDVPELVEKVVAVDPSGSSKEGSDECGMVVAGIDAEDIVYILEDATNRMSPHDWANKAIYLYDKWDADTIVYEKNYGGEMIEAIFSPIRKNLPLKDVWAKKGKLIRAEGPSLLYERGRVKHVKGLAKLEEEMTMYAGRGKSPNRLDAAVYAVQHLALRKQNIGKVTISDFFM